MVNIEENTKDKARAYKFYIRILTGVDEEHLRLKMIEELEEKEVEEEEKQEEDLTVGGGKVLILYFFLSAIACYCEGYILKVGCGSFDTASTTSKVMSLPTYVYTYMRSNGGALFPGGVELPFNPDLKKGDAEKLVHKLIIRLLAKLPSDDFENNRKSREYFDCEIGENGFSDRSNIEKNRKFIQNEVIRVAGLFSNTQDFLTEWMKV